MAKLSTHQSTPVAQSPSCTCAARYEQTISTLRRRLATAQARIAALTQTMDKLASRQLTQHAPWTTHHCRSTLLSPLTVRERQVALLFVTHMCDKAVAHTLGTAIQT